MNSETEKKLGKNLRLNNNGYKIAVAIVLTCVFSLLIGYYFVSRLPPEGYSAIYLLNYQQKKALDYPELLVINQNNTFNVWIEVVNHMGTQQSFKVLQKVISDTILSFPVEINVAKSYAQTIENGKTWQTLATVTITKPGSYYVIFELWYHDETGELDFSHNYCVLPIEVVDQT